MKIKDRMTHNPITVDVSLPIPEAMKLMKCGGFRRLPVLEHGKLVGCTMRMCRCCWCVPNRPIEYPNPCHLESYILDSQ
jgi:CBS domain